MIDGHGDDIHRYGDQIRYNFSSNVYYKGCPPALLAAISAAVGKVQNYPSPMAEELNEAAARKFSLSPEQLLFTNGATEAFYLIAHLFSGASAGIVAPTFSEYEDACERHGLHYELVRMESMSAGSYQLVFICNPNNPDGAVIPVEALTALIKGAPDTTFVIDEAYIEFTNQTESMAPWITQLPNLVIVRSLTKTFAIPGLRLGYVMASTALIRSLLNKKMPWSVNALALQAGLQIFQHYERWLFQVARLLEETRMFKEELSTISWLEVKPGHTSYFLAMLIQGKAYDLKEYLATRQGILIRDATNFKLLDGQYIRLSTQSPEANAALIKALKLWN